MLRRRFNQNASGEYMTLVASEGDTVFSVTKDTAATIQDFFYSINGGKWTKVNLGSENAASFNVAYGENIRFKSNSFRSERDASVRFFSSMPFSVTGNIMSLGYFDDAKGKTSLGSNRYASLFAYSQVRHVDANFLPAISLSDSCYEAMFFGCSYLESAPTLPSVVMKRSCYKSMFYGCTSLTTAPELPATTLAGYCYESMFYGCTSLTTAPELPATTLDIYCYKEMFYGCSKLNYIKMLATDISERKCLYNWVYGVASTGTFVKNPEATWDVVGANGVPSGWTVKFDGEESGGG